MILTAFIFYASSDSIINDIDNFSKLFQQTEGSTQEKEAINKIKNRLSSFNINFSEINFDDAENFHSFSSYIEADIAGEKDDTIITLIPLNQNYSIAAGLALAEYYSLNKPELSMKILFMGAESSDKNALASRFFLGHYYPEVPTAFIYMNFETSPSEFRIISGAEGYSSPYMLFKAVTTALDSVEIPWRHSNTEAMLFRLSSAGTKSRIGPYLAESYPAIEIKSSESADEHPLIDSEKLTGFYESMFQVFETGIPSEYDKNYILGLSEQNYLFIYILLITILMIFPIFRKRHFSWYMRTLIRNIWFIPVLFGSVFLFLSLTSILMGFVLNKLQFPELWKYIPFTLFLSKISIAIFLYLMAFRFIKKLPFSKRGSFYSITAIFFLVIVLFILTSINFSLSIFALWSLCFIFLFTVFRQPLLKLLMLIISTLWLVIILFEIFTIPSYPVIKLLIISPLKGDLLSALVLLPFILASIRLDMLSPPSKVFTRFLPGALGILSAALFIFIIVYSPFDASNPQPVIIKNNFDDDTAERHISFESPAKINKAADNFFREYSAAPIKTSGNILIDIKHREFLNRKILDFKLGFKESPLRIRVSLDSDSPITLYESNFPAEWFPSKNKLEIYIGDNPEIPLEVSLTINRDAEINLNIEADYYPEVENIEINGKHYILTKTKTIKKQYKDE